MSRLGRLVAGLGPAGYRWAGVCAGVVLVLMVGLGAFVVWSPGSGVDRAAAAAAPPNWTRRSVSATGLVDASGVKLIRVAVSGDGGLLDVRFQVVDPNKAAALHDARTPPAIVDERSGLVISELFMGHSHDGAFKPAVSYYLVFDNPGQWVQRGSAVTVLLGDAQVEHVVVV